MAEMDLHIFLFIGRDGILADSYQTVSKAGWPKLCVHVNKYFKVRLYFVVFCRSFLTAVKLARGVGSGGDTLDLKVIQLCYWIGLKPSVDPRDSWSASGYAHTRLFIRY